MIVGEDIVGTVTFIPLDGNIELVVDIDGLNGMFNL